MTEVLSNQYQQKAGVPKSKKTSVRVDLTPMVDLGFLLIAFFIFTTTLSQPTVMKLAIPDDRENLDSSEVPVNKTLNLILGDNNQAYVFNGLEITNMKNIGSSRSAIRSAILQKTNELKKNCGTDSGMIVLIKPTIAATYKDVVNALDEMLICNIKTYVLMDANADESEAIRQ